MLVERFQLSSGNRLDVVGWVFRLIVTGRFGIVTGHFGNVTDDSGGT